MKNIFKLQPLLALLAALGACVSRPHPQAKVFNVRHYGATGDGKTLDTAAIQKALDDCGQAGGGVVRLSSGTYLSKPIFLRANTTLQLDRGALLQARDEPSDFSLKRGLPPGLPATRH
jgi:polygalacturonase